MKKILVCLIIMGNLLFSNEISIKSDGGISLDYETGEILFKKNLDFLYAPASLTKLVTIYIVYNQISEGLFSLDSLVPISKNSDWRNSPKGSSLMFIEEGQRVTVLELLKGLAISSGNDAAIAISEFISKDKDSFVDLMNQTVNGLGFSSLYFCDPSGFDDNNQMTLLEFAQFCRIFIKKYPFVLDELFSLEEFSYPLSINGPSSVGTISQKNRNQVVLNDPRADGLKTGFIHKSGMNLALTGFSSNRRVIIILTGARHPNKAIAEQIRIDDAELLLNYSLNNFVNTRLDKIDLPNVTIAGTTIKPIISLKSPRTVPRVWDSISYKLPDEVSRPLYRDMSLGKVTLEYEGNIYSYSITTSKIIR